MLNIIHTNRSKLVLIKKSTKIKLFVKLKKYTVLFKQRTWLLPTLNIVHYILKAMCSDMKIY